MIGIYYLFKGGEIIYVGSSVDIEKRIDQHKRKGADFDGYTFLHLTKSNLRLIEAIEINRLKPINNIRIPPLFSELYPEKLKMLQVEASTHKQIKRQAKAKGMSIKAYIQELLDKDN